MGAQKNFAQYAKRIGKEWDKHPDSFNEFYFRRAIARAILFRKTEKLVSAQPWYNGGYRANIVAYTLALLGFYCEKKGCSMDFMKLWESQSVSENLQHAIEVTARLVNDDITNPEAGISNVTEWCKKALCWLRLQQKYLELERILPAEFESELISKSEIVEEKNQPERHRKLITVSRLRRKCWRYPGQNGRAYCRERRERAC